MAQVSVIHGPDGKSIDYTPGSAVTGGDVVAVGNILGIAVNDIAANALGSLSVTGLKYVPKTTAAWTVGLPVYWNSTGDPDSGTAGTGAANQLGAGVYMGIAALAAGSGDDRGYVLLNERGSAGPSRVRTATVAAAGTNASNAGQLIEGFNLVTGPDDTKGVVLPPAAAGAQVIIKVGDGADLKVWPATGDAINAIAVDSAMTVVDDVCFVLTALDSTTWYTTPLLPS